MTDLSRTETAPIVGTPQRADAKALAAELMGLTRLDATALRAEWRRLYRVQPPSKLSRDLLELAVAWKLQERALGGLTATSKRQLAELARALATKSDLTKSRQTRLKPGARIMRHWGGETHEVIVAEDGFLWRDRSWKSLSVIARKITGARWSGPRFFGLDRIRAGRARP